MALSLDRAQVQVGETINFTATVTNGPGAVVTATIAGPDKPVFGPFKHWPGRPLYGSYTDTTPAGSYLVTVRHRPHGQNSWPVGSDDGPGARFLAGRLVGSSAR